MADISSIPSATSSSGSSSKPQDLKDLDINQFLQLMITELTNQDPMNPMDNTELVQQIGSIREISATDNLSSALLSVQTGQSLATASNLIGKTVTALNDQAQNVTGTVDRVSVEVDPKNDAKRIFQIHIGDSAIDLKNVREVKS